MPSSTYIRNFVIACAVAIFILSVEYFPGNLSPAQYYSTKRGGATNTSLIYAELDDDDVQRDRIRLLQQTCQNITSQLRRRGSSNYHISQKYNFSFCKVPKVGSTFMTQVLYILNHGVSKSVQAFHNARSRVHVSLKGHVVAIQSSERVATESLLTVRNPYSRLFSAYVDKSYLPLIFRFAINVNQYKRLMSNVSGDFDCPSNVTFEDFLKYILHLERQEKNNNPHFAPIVSLCQPCSVKPFAIIKQESFAKDLEYALRRVGVAQDKYDVIRNAMRAHRAETTIPPIVKTVLNRSTKSTIQKCLGWMEVYRRVWDSFQIQGYINETLPFPKEQIVDSVQRNPRDDERFSKIILDIIAKNPMTSAESKIQRQRALVKAYQNVDKETIQGIQTFYRQDFELFGYSMVPPGFQTIEN